MNELEKTNGTAVPANAEKREVQARPAPRAISPACDICEGDGLVEIRLEMPGVGRDQAEITVERDTLTVRASLPDEPVEGTWLLRERPRRDYFKSFTIDERVDRERIEATVADGVMKIILRVKEAAKPRKVEIKAA